ncbi:MAG: hypothetical protein IT385_24210 [Deltaproteobacteria bacterium]|nr:hypothetical protein [Deltaproteobacteria bacterium]
MKRSLLSLACLSLAAVAACGDDPETIIDLTVIETMPVDFGAMQAGVLESAVFNLDDLRDEAAYQEAAGKLRCAGLDARASSLFVKDLVVGAGATTVDYRVGVRQRDSGAYTELVRFAGSITKGDEMTLDGAKFTLNPQGLQTLSQVVLGATPMLDVEVVASVPGGVDAMVLELELVTELSTQSKGCPSLTTGL